MQKGKNLDQRILWEFFLQIYSGKWCHFFTEHETQFSKTNYFRDYSDDIRELFEGNTQHSNSLKTDAFFWQKRAQVCYLSGPQMTSSGSIYIFLALRSDIYWKLEFSTLAENLDKMHRKTTSSFKRFNSFGFLIGLWHLFVTMTLPVLLSILKGGRS